MSCHTISDEATIAPGGSIALVGHPNVGKSVIFNLLTGRHVTISNYPGTTVEVARASVQSLPETALIDTPGVVMFPPRSDDEQVTGKVLLAEPLRAVLQVGDAKNLRRTLQLTVQLAEMGLPLVLALNMMDEARARGVEFDHARLSAELGCPVIPTTAIHGAGVDELVASIQTARTPTFHLDYPPEIEALVNRVTASLNSRADGEAAQAPISARSLALLWLSHDRLTDEWLSSNLDQAAYQSLMQARAANQAILAEDQAALIQKTRQAFVEQLTQRVIVAPGTQKGASRYSLSKLTTHPIWGFGILAVVMYAMYWFVGVFGASTLVGLLENRLFGEIINPRLVEWVYRLMPVKFIADYLVGEYGVWTMGMTYALALIFPIVTTFFLAFGILEDSGYLPRLAVLSNRIFQTLGLNGKAVLPMVLGLGCVTMATLTTRVLESKRERLLVMLLLALAVPCSAQLGVVMGMLAGISFSASLIWASVVGAILLLVGWLAARLVPGERVQLLVELPPLRVPQLSNVVVKTLARLEWYIKEVIPLFLIGTTLMFVLDKIGVLGWISRAGEPLVTGWLGLPPQASAAFLMGFLRRDFGATGLFVMQSQGLLTPVQVVVAMVTITLFIPCIASVMVIARERDVKTSLGMMAIIFPVAFLIGGMLFRVLVAIGWGA